MGLAVPIGYGLLFTLALLIGIGALFGATVWRLGRRRGRAMVLLAWLACTLVFGGLYAARVLQAQRSLGFPAERQRPLVVFAMFTTLLAFTLGLPALNVVRRVRSAPELRTAAIARSSAGWAFAGIVLALLVSLAIDVVGVLASPVR
jgi:hypothetical protein